MAGELVAPGDDRRRRLGKRLDGVTRDEPRGRDPAPLEELEEPWGADPRPVLPVRELDDRIAAADGIGEGIVVEREGDGQPRGGGAGSEAASVVIEAILVRLGSSSADGRPG